MALNTKLELRQGQQLVMTPQLQQAIRLLQLSNLELTDFVEAELERNPLLERDDQVANEPPDSSSNDDARDDWLNLAQPIDDGSGLDTDFRNVFEENNSSGTAATPAPAPDSGMGWAGTSQRMHSGDDSEFNLESIVADDVSLRDHLMGQVPFVLQDPVEKLIGHHLIDLMDDAGYIPSDLDVLAERLGAPLELVENVLAKMQTLDPPGVFARSLAECLALQLKDQNRFDPLMASLLANLELLASRNITSLRKELGVDVEELGEMIQEIKRLDPKPGHAFNRSQVQTLVADVIVKPAPDGGWLIELNNDTLPRVLVNRSYYTTISKGAVSEKDKGYLDECLQTANWLIKSLDQRARTILKVADQIVRQQDAFLMYGVQHLRPLNLKTVADAVSMHESTVSRVTSNKYIMTPRGIFELKYFFTSAIASSSDGEAHSSESVRYQIRRLVDSEPSTDVLSDDQIVERLKAQGIDIARRTVTKYRESMNIPSSVQRRREKRHLARLSPEDRASLHM